MSACFSCPVGRYAPSPGAANCFSCDPGCALSVRFHLADVQLSDQTVVRSRFANTTGLSACYLCPRGSTSGIKATQCSPVRLLSLRVFPFLIVDRSRLQCPPGQIAASQGQSICTTCAAGERSNRMFARSSCNALQAPLAAVLVAPRAMCARTVSHRAIVISMFGLITAV